MVKKEIYRDYVTEIIESVRELRDKHGADSIEFQSIRMKFQSQLVGAVAQATSRKQMTGDEGKAAIRQVILLFNSKA